VFVLAAARARNALPDILDAPAQERASFVHPVGERMKASFHCPQTRLKTTMKMTTTKKTSTATAVLFEMLVAAPYSLERVSIFATASRAMA
jgi:hypothetical protein